MTSLRPILIHSYAGPLGGSERILLDLVSRIDRPALLACPAGPLADAAEAIDLPVIRLAERPLEARGRAASAVAAAQSIAHGMEIKRLATDVDAAMVISWGMRSAVASTAVWASPTGGLRGNRPPLVAEHVDLLPEGIQGRIARRALLSCDRVVCLSEAIASDLDPEWGRSSLIKVVHPGTDSGPRLGQEPDSPPTVLMLAALEPWKGQDMALEAVARTDGVRLVVAGSPLSERGERFADRLRSRANRPDLAGRVEFPGTIDPHEALAGATLLLHCSPAEPFGRAMTDALAAGRPVVAADAAGAREIVTPSCGRLVPASDPAAFARALTEVCFTPGLAARLGESGRQRAIELFDQDRQAEEWRRAALSPVTGSPSSGHRSLGHPDERGVPQRAPLPRDLEGDHLSLVTVIHDSAPDLSRLLASVTRHLPGAEVIVVDSGSSDSGPAIASTWSGGATVVTLPSNEGYGSGCVAGMVEVTRPVTALINPDVELIDSSLAVLAESLIEPGADDRLLSPLLIHPDGRRQDAVHPVPGTPAELLRALIPASLLPPPLNRIAEPHRAARSGAVGWAVGACLVGRSESLRRLGPFDPAVHLYAEDLDLCLRAAESGIETWYRPDARVIHREAHSTRKAFGGEPTQLLARRRRAVVKQRLGRSALRRDDAIQLITNVDRLAMKRILGRDTHLERSRIAALKAARRDSAR